MNAFLALRNEQRFITKPTILWTRTTTFWRKENKSLQLSWRVNSKKEDSGQILRNQVDGCARFINTYSYTHFSVVSQVSGEEKMENLTKLIKFKSFFMKYQSEPFPPQQNLSVDKMNYSMFKKTLKNLIVTVLFRNIIWLSTKILLLCDLQFRK